MPTTSVEKMSGAMRDLIIRRKIAERGFSSPAVCGYAQPIRVPTTIATMIHCVSETLRRTASIDCTFGWRTQGARSATLGYGVQPLRGKNHRPVFYPGGV